MNFLLLNFFNKNIYKYFYLIIYKYFICCKELYKNKLLFLFYLSINRNKLEVIFLKK